MTVRVVADGVNVNPVPGMVRARVAELTSAPSVPVNKTLYVPAGVLVWEVKFTVTLPLELSEEGEKLAWTPEGRPLALNETLPVRPPTKVTESVTVGFVFGGNESVVGDTVMVNSGLAVTVRVMVAVSMVEPLVPITVTVASPTVAVLLAVKLSVLPPDPVTEVGLKLAVTPAGRPLTVKATALSKPLNAATVTLPPTVVPCITVVEVPETVKPGDVVLGSGGYAFCTSSRNSVSQKVPALGEFGMESISILLASTLVLVGLQFGSPVVEVTPLYTLPG